MDDDLDRILASDAPPAPSSGFQARVMEGVRHQGLELPALPFPWLRFYVGIAACVTLAATGAGFAPRVAGIVLGWCAPLGALGAVGPELGLAALAVIGGVGLGLFPRVLAELRQ
jgi:hypothetical protein